jgi:uncharacterized protein YlzI (FlbEa/FlbD family)
MIKLTRQDGKPLYARPGAIDLVGHQLAPSQYVPSTQILVSGHLFTVIETPEEVVESVKTAATRDQEWAKLRQRQEQLDQRAEELKKKIGE